jgi:hypothetical protein
MNGDEYRRHACACLELASQTSDSDSKTALIHMAFAWLRLGEQAEKNLTADLVYEPPFPRPQPDTRVAQQEQQQIQPESDGTE